MRNDNRKYGGKGIPAPNGSFIKDNVQIILYLWVECARMSILR